ncbi:unnamed protein product [Rotaria magnacalcarata]|uniref:Uncharacterized protein n=1 Tax=Rotaria magnacalcarata TaxID=392030 RepID=A0A816YHM5_9BILA|nr:unnamed protein product [Rotaria magnacalcarata]CAF3910798.1 unnamed protein product [Rotaria magnacalcarata]
MPNIKKINSDKQIINDIRSNSITPEEEKEDPPRLIFSPDSSIDRYDKSDSYDIGSLKSIHSVEISVDDSRMIQNHSNIDQEKSSFIDSTFNDNRYQSTTCNLQHDPVIFDSLIHFAVFI